MIKGKKTIIRVKSKVKPKRIRSTHHVSLIMYEYIMPNILQDDK